MNTYTFTDSNGVVHEFQTSATLPVGPGTIDQPSEGTAPQGGGGPGDVRPPR